MPKTDMSLKNFWASWKWVSYPVIVFFVVIISVRWFFGSPDQGVGRLINSQQRVSENEQRVVRLTTKIGALQRVDVARETAQLNLLATAVPVTKPVTSFIDELYGGGLESGSELISYSGRAGEIATESAVVQEENELLLTAIYRTDDIGSILRLLQSLEKKLPLIEVTDLEFVTGRTSITARSMWSPLVKIQIGLDEALPDYSAQLPAVLNDLSAFQVSIPVVPAAATPTPLPTLPVLPSEETTPTP